MGFGRGGVPSRDQLPRARPCAPSAGVTRLGGELRPGGASAVILWTSGEMAERLKAHAWKACVPKGTVGSNPTLSATKSAVAETLTPLPVTLPETPALSRGLGRGAQPEGNRRRRVPGRQRAAGRVVSQYWIVALLTLLRGSSGSVVHRVFDAARGGRDCWARWQPRRADRSGLDAVVPRGSAPRTRARAL